MDVITITFSVPKVSSHLDWQTRQLGPDYMSWAGLLSQATTVCQEPGWPGCHVIANLIFIPFTKRAKIPVN